MHSLDSIYRKKPTFLPRANRHSCCTENRQKFLIAVPHTDI